MARMISDNFNNCNVEEIKPLIFYSSPGHLQDLASVAIATYHRFRFKSGKNRIVMVKVFFQISLIRMARMISDNFNNCNVEEIKPLIFYSSPGHLQDLASVAIATYLWSFHQENFFKLHGTFKKNVHGEKICDELQIAYSTQPPTVIREKVDKSAHLVTQNLINWCECNCCFINDRPSMLFDVFHLILWNSCGDGNINYRRTARNLVESDELNGKQKYVVACINCFVEDIKKLVSERHDNYHPLVHYWNCRVEGKEYEVTDMDRNVEIYMEMSEDVFPRPGCSSVETSILWHYLAAEWITMPEAFEYFWKYLTKDEQVEIIIEKSDFVDKFLEHVLCTLDEQQLRSVIELSCGNIFVMFYNRSETHALLLWNHIENMISATGFYFIICAFLLSNAYETAIKFWLSASDTLRNDVLIQYKDSILEQMCIMNRYGLTKNFRGDARLMIEFLTADPSYPKEEFWIENWKRIIVGTPLQQLHLIMKLCLGSDDEVAKFKNMHMCEYSEIENYLFRMVSAYSFVELNEFLRFIAEDDPEIIFDLRIRILKSTWFFNHYYVTTWRIAAPDHWVICCDQFIEDTFHDSDHLNMFRKNFIINEATFRRFRFDFLGGNIGIGPVEKLCDYFFSSMPDVLTEVKNKLLELGREVLISAEFTKFSSTIWETFVKWCFNSNKYSSIKSFKDTLPLDIIFDKLIHKSILELKQYTDWELSNDMNKFEEGSCCKCLALLQSFLHWFFEFNDEILDFKLSKLNAGENTIKEIRLLQKSNNGILVDILMKWFFLEQAGEFYSDNFEASLFDCLRSVE